ncbi:MAG: ZIP family metal transporter [Candidatus Aenigmarchaeota archaeon]|nr:ZIP family metal transporter [Candidatus Aenigmarchaeota archaeon]
MVLNLILVSSTLISLIAFIGLFSLLIRKKSLEKIILGLVGLSAGTLMGGAFIHLLPEAMETTENAGMWVIAGFTLFYLVEKFLQWHHCREHKHTIGYINLIGDLIHNFTDGLILAATYITNVNLGIITTFIIALHEIPQEIGDFGVLVYSGFERKRALILNFLVALSVIVGGVIGYFGSMFIKDLAKLLVPIAAGGFVYISASDLIPEIRRETKIKKSLFIFLVFVLGILIMLAGKLWGKV